MPAKTKGADPRRRRLVRALAALGSAVLAGCDRLAATQWFPAVLGAGEKLNNAAQHLVASRRSMAQEFSPADLSPRFRSNGTSRPNDPQYLALAEKEFVDWRLRVEGLVEHPQEFSLAQLRALPRRTQITRHDCVEGWSAIGQWTGVPLAEVLKIVQPTANARFVVFYCADPMEDDGTDRYYESIDMDDAYHPQTILAYELNGSSLPIENGAPIRARVERQLGYKMAKFIMRIELVQDFARINGGNGGYWEDQGYQWYAGI
jgi:DMSO/TMAO reductase YedYZ molybdopterin-dependent catalytic subunit